jgi:hypothetical protein
MFCLWSLGALHLQALIPPVVERFAIACLRLEDPNDQVVSITRQRFSIHGENLAIYFVTTTNSQTYVIKVIKLENFSPTNVDDFRGSQLIYQRLQSMQCPPNVQFALTHYCQVIGEETIYSLENELPLDKKGNLMLWMPKAPGKSVDDLRVTDITGDSETFLQSIAQADTLLYQNGIGLGHALNPGRIKWDPETSVLTIVNTAGVHVRDSNVPFSKYMIGAYFSNMFMSCPDFLEAAINFYENPALKESCIKIVKENIADRFHYTVTYTHPNLTLDLIIALIDSYRNKSLIPPRIFISAVDLFAPTIQRGELVSIFLTNLSNENKAALRKMYEQKTPKADAQCGNADPEICEAFQYYLSKISCFPLGPPMLRLETVDSLLDSDSPRAFIQPIVQYFQITEPEEALYASVFPNRSKDKKYNREFWGNWRFVIE